MFTFKKSISSVLVLATFLTTTNAFAMNPGEEDKPGTARPAAVAPATAQPAVQAQVTESRGGWLKLLAGGAVLVGAAFVLYKGVQANRAQPDDQNVDKAANNQQPVALPSAPALEESAYQKEIAAQDAQLDTMLTTLQGIHKQSLELGAILDAEKRK